MPEKGYEGKLLRVNLTKGEVKTENISEKVYRRYLGGSGFATYYLMKELKAGVDPYGPDNKLIFSVGVMTGTTVPGASRFTIACKSPLTGGFAEAEAGGFWAPEFKKTGFDAIIFEGISPEPVYLWVHDGEAELRDASHLSGKHTGDAEKAIRDELDDSRIRVAQIGPAGENKVKYACVLNECSHANGRVGIGAVMGSKNLRAVACRGTLDLKIAEPDKVKDCTQNFANTWRERSQGMRDFGTPGLVTALDGAGILPTRNFLDGSFEGAEKISGQTMAETILQNPGGCFACPIRCKRDVKVEGKYEVDPHYGGPEYETLGSLGSLCGVDDLEAVAKGNELCNKYGLDTISTGVSIAFAMECFENGIIDENDTGGLELKFGNAEAMVEVIEKIINRDGIGDILAEGVKRAAEKFGDGAEKYAMHVKGQEIPMHEPRGKVGVGLGYAFSPTGADHCELGHDTSFVDFGPALDDISPLGIIEPVDNLDLGNDKVRLVHLTQKIYNIYNSVGMCNFTSVPIGPLSLNELVENVRAITGWNTSLFELVKSGERANTLARLFNLREGITAEEDKLPERFFEPLRNGALEGEALDKDEFYGALEKYYKLQGWDENGVPTEDRLMELDLEWVTE